MQTFVKSPIVFSEYYTPRHCTSANLKYIPTRPGRHGLVRTPNISLTVTWAVKITMAMRSQYSGTDACLFKHVHSRQSLLYLLNGRGYESCFMRITMEILCFFCIFLNSFCRL